jgi:uncharacterized protein (TIRG00374 family)
MSALRGRRLQLILFAVGTALFVYLVRSIGLRQLWENARTTGWMIVPILLLYGLVFVCNAAALRLVLRTEPRRPGFARTWAIVASGSAMNFVTPLANVGGEPYRIAALAPWVGGLRAAGAVVVHTMLRYLSFFLVWLTALALGLVLLPQTPVTVALILGGMVAVGALTGLLLAAYRRGLLEALLDRLHRVPGLRRVARRLEPRRAGLAAADRQITEFYHQRPGHFVQALLLEYASRCLFMLELCLIGLSVGVPISYPKAFVIGGLEALVTNLLFFIPYEVGTRESAMLLLFRQLGYPSGLGLYAALVSRVRDMFWIGAGLALIWASGRGRAGVAEPQGGTPL